MTDYYLLTTYVTTAVVSCSQTVFSVLICGVEKGVCHRNLVWENRQFLLSINNHWQAKKKRSVELPLTLNDVAITRRAQLYTCSFNNISLKEFFKFLDF